MKALCLVAHPDDELVFAGALMLSRPHWDWTVVALTAGPRLAQFRGISLGFPDEWRIVSLAEWRLWKEAVRELPLEPDVVVTHNLVGDYGHPHHMSVHRIATELFGKSVWTFWTYAESSVDWEREDGVVSRIDAGEDKVALFIDTYGIGVLNELRADHPELIAEKFYRHEFFKGPRALPS